VLPLTQRIARHEGRLLARGTPGNRRLAEVIVLVKGDRRKDPTGGAELLFQAGRGILRRGIQPRITDLIEQGEILRPQFAIGAYEIIEWRIGVTPKWEVLGQIVVDVKQ
jgi:hypothetical protein